MNFKTKNISPLELNLDKENPRFIVSNINSENEIINYMLENEEIIELANGINANKGLLVGERVVVFKEGNNYIVAEGNRRTCACKILLNNAFLPNIYKDKLEEVSEETKKNIETV